jgi:hypothetical protein
VSGFLVAKMVLFLSGKNGFVSVQNWFIYVWFPSVKLVLCQVVSGKIVLCWLKIGLFMSGFLVPKWFYVSLLVAKMVLCQFKVGLGVWFPSAKNGFVC